MLKTRESPNGLSKLSVGRHPQNLSGQFLLVLSTVAIARISERGIEHLVRTERQPPAVVEVRGRQSVEDRLLLTQGQIPGFAEEVELHDPILRTSGEESIETVIVDGEPVETGLTRGRGIIDPTDLTNIPTCGDFEDATRIAFAYQHALSVEGDRPRGFESGGDDLGRARTRCGRTRSGIGARNPHSPTRP